MDGTGIFDADSLANTLHIHDAKTGYFNFTVVTYDVNKTAVS